MIIFFVHEQIDAEYKKWGFAIQLSYEYARHQAQSFYSLVQPHDDGFFHRHLAHLQNRRQTRYH